MVEYLHGRLAFNGVKDGFPVFTVGGKPFTPAPAVTRPVRTAPATSPSPSGRKAPTPNQYGGSCGRCGVWVQPGNGTRAKIDEKWATVHLPDGCPSSGAAVATTMASKQVKVRPVRTPDGKQPLTGYFTVTLEDDSWVTLRIHQPKNRHRLHVDYMFGTGNTSDGSYTLYATVDDQGRGWALDQYADNERLRKAMAAVFGDQETAGKAFAQRFKQCWRCNKPLSNPQSMDRLMGDDCHKKLYG